MIELLQPKAGEKILDIGSGSGWQTAILADIVGEAVSEGDRTTGSVVAIERIPELKAISEVNIGRYGFIEQAAVTVVLGDGVKGYRKSAPYDRIIASASAEGDVPVAWKRQLKIGGRIVAPVGSSIVVIDKISKTKYNKKEYFGYSFSPLVIS
jgi:protein-L-isoaspartate(D-aspartate) O-methyltransferase